jgi:hypothetical protein
MTIVLREATMATATITKLGAYMLKNSRKPTKNLHFQQDHTLSVNVYAISV